ncbi:hypothetical protein MHYP_G00350250 [Metynnis hypsauchen]
MLFRMLRDAGIVDEDFLSPSDVVLVGCSGKQANPEGICNLKLELYGFSFMVPVLIVDGQVDQLILGTNVLKPLIRQFKNNDGYWKVMSKPDTPCQSTNSQFLRLLSNLERWRGETIPDKIGTVKLKSAVTLKPLGEHLVWARLPPGSKLSVGSTVVVEPSTSRVPRNTLVGRVISPLWGDGWLPVKIVNPTTAEITLRKNAKVADVFPCIALEDLESIRDVSTQQNVGALRSECSEGSLTAKSFVKGSRTSSDRCFGCPVSCLRQTSLVKLFLAMFCIVNGLIQLGVTLADGCHETRCLLCYSPIVAGRKVLL